jgi:plasmid stability protein
MGSVLIRNLDDDIIARLKARALEQGTSLEQYLRDSITRMAEPTREQVLAEIRAIRARSQHTGISVVEDLRAWRDGEDDKHWEGPAERR